ncbi:MAG: excinuclease ABC subunit UvrA [Mesorhizobium sp.]|uniref:excinuclease ABC subunit UvrA n=1 Tax=Mesorhizobium sp. TaxID=1871066 RepID=UPI000FEA02BD|nr:excinuclease ABC subunit UvrA [Mesorhizobium sp.]RWB08723.1 MAG: excinuclease ABC subunit UvrA [Mesorhizobium sp.]RWB13624.1 MAG: excinuclease ABC subunit UvrA [Mesorhizobium sp.]
MTGSPLRKTAWRSHELQSHEAIRVVGSREHNLKNVSIDIPKKLITVFTGVSGSGKSSLVFDTIAAESQRQLNETFSSFARHRLPHYGQPDVDLIENLAVAIVVDQKRLGGNARSTVGTATDIQALLRLLFSRVGEPFVGLSSVFSFNHPDGMCPRCEGIGAITTVDVDALLDRSKSLNDGAIRFPLLAVGSARWKRYVLSGYFDNDKKLEDYSPEEWELLLNAEPHKPPHPAKGWWASSMYEGLIPRFHRSFLHNRSSSDRNEALESVVTSGLCPDCHGARLRPEVLACKINGNSIADLAAMPASDLVPIVAEISTTAAVPIVAALCARLDHMTGIGLGYISMDRQTSTLSGGESQRVKMLRHLGSSLTDLTYVFDEPSIGLHPRDVNQMIALLREIRDKGNTVLVVEHDPQIIAIADHVIDMGPGAGESGGRVVFKGKVADLKRSDTLTGRFMKARPHPKAVLRPPTGWLKLRNANLHNLKNVSVDIPQGVLTAVVGVAGSGKSSLINGVFSRRYPDAVCIDQGALGGSIRSNTATYTGVLDPIRKLFAEANSVGASLFSSNSAGACPGCKGLGVTRMDMAFMDTIVSACEVCHGRRFTDAVLAYKLRGKNIDDVLSMSVSDAQRFFHEPDIRPALDRVAEVGLDYMTLGQPLSSLSGGERQRIKLATELQNTGRIFILDEPTTGLHMSDVARLVRLMGRLADSGNTLLVIEHNLDVITQADWIIEMGPGAGQNGGSVIFKGNPIEMINSETSQTAPWIRAGASLEN